MALTFYPYTEDAQRGTVGERIDILMEAAERYKAVVLDVSTHETQDQSQAQKRIVIPRELTAAYNWEEIAHVLREVREMPEGSKNDKIIKSRILVKLAEVYEVLRAAKMAKLEAVRLALISESNQLNGDASQVA